MYSCLRRAAARRRSLAFPSWIVFPALAIAQAAATPTPAPTPAPVNESVVVSATRGSTPEAEIPGEVTVITGEELKQRNVTNLADAIQDVVGLDTGMGSDNGPRQPNVGLWGLKEFDALLFMVDGVPIGGPFNPSLSQINIDDIDHIEIVKGPQGTLYGVSAFAGMIQVFTKSGDRRARRCGCRGGSFSKGRVDVSTVDPDRALRSSGSAATSTASRGLAGPHRLQGRPRRIPPRHRRSSGGGKLRRSLQHVPEHAVLRLAAARRSADAARSSRGSRSTATTSRSARGSTIASTALTTTSRRFR